MSIVSKTVPEFPPWPCPACGASHAPIRFDDADTIDLPETLAALRDRIHALLNWGRCPSCHSGMAVLEIVVRHPGIDIRFVADNCWSAQQTTLHRLVGHGHTWCYEHERGITFEDQSKAEWIGRHYLGPMPTPAEVQAGSVLARLAPVLASWSPPSPDICTSA